MTPRAPGIFADPAGLAIAPDGPQRIAAAIALAVAVDLLLGDPPNRWHPVAWMGSLLGWGRRHLESGSPRALLLRGAALVALVAAVAGLAGWGVSLAIRPWGWIGVILEALALKSMISLRDLISACGRVAGALTRGDLIEARRLVGHDLVSRDATGLDAGLVASAAVESAAENLTDACLAPLACYLAFGLGGACVYRAVNTADAMIGYRLGALEHLGKAAARLDDLLNLLPARAAALAIAVAAGLAGGDARGAWRAMWRDHGRTASPNAGWTMSAMAGALGVRLEKAGVYRLGDGPLPGPPHIRRCLRIFRVAALLAMGSMVGALILRSYSR
jgi:adenosylcobinamide-phosphate synthase